MAGGHSGEVTIHSAHPFATPGANRDQVRRFRGRLAAPVTVWTATSAEGRPVGWTVSSVLVAVGDPGEVLGLIDPDCDFYDALLAGGVFAVNLLGWAHRNLSDAMAGLAPAPGGPFKLHSWDESQWGPVLVDSPGWLGARLSIPPDPAGRLMLVRAEIEHVEVTGGEPLSYLQGRYRRP